DQASINDWDLPFPLIHRIRGQDDDYWNHHRTTPKAFVNLAVGKRLWGSRFGSATTMRIANTTHPDDLASATDLANVLQQAVHDSGQSLGMHFQPVKRDGLAAASGSTPFDGLFLGLSLFVIAAALMLIAVLFQLGIQQRASQLGLLLAVGLTRKQITRLLIGEAFLIACLGSLAGCALGVGYGRLMLTGLQTWWIDALITSFLEFHVSSRSLLIGYAAGVSMSLGTIVWSIRSTKKLTPCLLLAGQAEATVVYSSNTGRRSRAIAIGLLLMGILLAVCAAIPGLSDRLGSEGQAGAFVGGGFCVLTSFLIGIRRFLRGGWNASSIQKISSPLAWLASRNAGRNPGRSTLTIGLMAMASFLLIAMGSFKLAPSQAGRGGFEFWGLSSMPVYENLAQEDLRIQVFGKQRAEKLHGESIQCLRFKSGDDASCSNVYQATQPRILGIPQLFVDSYDAEQTVGFVWGMHTADPAIAGNPWHLLDSHTAAHAGTATHPVPVVIDKNTALYSLKLYGGADQIFAVEYDERTIHFQVVGLLSNSILQGSLLISERDFTNLFPNISGYRYFLSTNHNHAAAVIEYERQLALRHE
ncbi:MAG: ABC transporter permease, partial [Pseudomonadales bacterium]|nr:ABC transporter permease [Pseudomonadales bacterium]